MANSHSTRRPRKGLLLLATLALAAVALSANAPTVNAVGCKVKTDAPSAVDPTTSSASFDDYSEDDETIPSDDDYNDDAAATPSDDLVDEYDEVGAENEEGVIGATPATKTPKPKKTKKVKTPKPSKKPKATKAPKATTAPAVAPEVENDATSAPAPVPVPVPSKTTKAPTPAVTKVPTPAVTKAPTPAVSKAPTPAAAGVGNATLPSSNGGKCVVGDPTQYISKKYVDWIWENRMKKEVMINTHFLYNQLVENKGKLRYCLRWDSTNKLPKATASRLKATLEQQYAQWNKWLVGYGCWPISKIEVEMVGVAVLDKALLDWSDDSLGPIYEKVLDNEGVAMCPDTCYRYGEGSGSNCKGKVYDVYLRLTKTIGGGIGGTGYDWGQQVDEDSVLGSLDASTSHILAHEIGHGFGLPDFYEESDKPGPDMPKMIMEAGASMVVTEGDGWLLRRGWENIRSRWPETSG